MTQEAVTLNPLSSNDELSASLDAVFAPGLNVYFKLKRDSFLILWWSIWSVYVNMNEQK